MNQDKLNEMFASLEKKSAELKAYIGDNPQSNEFYKQLASFADDMYSSMNYMRQNINDRIDSNASKLDEHMSKGHAPAFKSNKHLNNFLKACDMESDYTTTPQDISACSYAYKITASKEKGVKLELDLTKPK